MDSNYQGQKQRVGERHAARMREAQAHRLMKENSPLRANQAESGSDSILQRLWRKLFGGETKGVQVQGRGLRPCTASNPADAR
jgi:hypothetical protein